MAKQQKQPIDQFDRRLVFEKNCRPLLEELILKCRLFNIPCFFTACVKSTEGTTEYVMEIDDPEADLDYINDAVCTGSKNIYLKDDKITKHLAVAAGFDVIPRREELEVSFDELDFFEEEEINFPGVDDDF